MLDIKTLLTRVANGESQAYAGVVDRFQRPLFGYLGRMGLSQGEAEDIAQETFLRAWQRFDTYDPRRSEFSTWLFTIARNLALNALEREVPTRGSSTEAAPADALPDGAIEAAERLIELQRRDRLRAALRELAVADRSALALAYFRELDLAAIARIEGCSTGAVKVRIHRAKQRLRALLEDIDG